MSIKKAIILAGGRGTRFLPVTKAIPKELLPIIDRPVLDYIVDEITASGIEDILIITAPGKENIKRYFTHDLELENTLRKSVRPELAELVNAAVDRARFSFALQSEPLGSGHALLSAEEWVDGEPFALLNGDDVVFCEGRPVAGQLADAFEKYGVSILGVQVRLSDDIIRYGVADVEAGGNRAHKMRGVIEKPPLNNLPSRLTSLGRYVLTSDVFDVIRRTPKAKNGEMQLTDALNALCGEKGMMAYEFEGVRYDLGDKLGSVQAAVEYALRRDDFGKEFALYIKLLAARLDA